jgi:transcriptional regulator with XRE-family HTH domain
MIDKEFVSRRAEACEKSNRSFINGREREARTPVRHESSDEYKTLAKPASAPKAADLTSNELSDYIEKGPFVLAEALKGLRLRKGWTAAEAATQAGIPTEHWEAWEEASGRPSLNALRRALTRLSWIWNTECLTSESGTPTGPSGEKVPDAELWRAYDLDSVWHDVDEEAAKLMTPEARLAWQEADQVVFGIDDPEVLQRKLEAMKAEVEQAESTFGGFLGLRRQWSQKSVEEMARKAGVDVATWQAWEAGEVLPSVTEVEALGHRIYVSSTARARMLEIRKAMAP